MEKKPNKKKIIKAIVLSFFFCAAIFLIGRILFLANKPNVILITAQSLRPDHLSCYGYGRIRTRSIDDLAKRGYIFKNAYCNTPAHYYSGASILTGKISGSVISKKGNFVFFNLSQKSLSEYLKGQGYSTIAIVSEPFLTANNSFFKRGFDVFENVLEKLPRDQYPLIGEKVTQNALGALAKSRNRPVFAWIEYCIPQYPYVVPESFQKDKGDFPYDRQVLFLDEEISKLMRGVKKLGLNKNTLIIFTATSGEGLNEHAEPISGIFLYNSTVKIPLIIKFPNQFKGRTVKDVCSNIDIAPTILSASRVKYSENDFDGKSLLPSLQRKESRPVYLESLAGYDDFGWSPLVGMVSGGYKYIEAPKPELYNLALDPYELANIAALKQDKAKEMRGALLKYLEKNRPPVLKILNKGADPKNKADILKPFFIALSAQAMGADVNILTGMYKALLDKDPDNKTFMFTLAKLYAQAEKPQSAEYYLVMLTEKYPDFFEAWELLGMTFDSQKKSEEAIKCYEKALSIFSDLPFSLNNLAWAYVKKGIKLDEALKYSQRANDLIPNNPSFLDTLVEVYFKKGNKEKAIELLRKAVSIDPKSDYLQNRLKEMQGSP